MPLYACVFLDHTPPHPYNHAQAGASGTHIREIGGGLPHQLKDHRLLVVFDIKLSESTKNPSRLSEPRRQARQFPGVAQLKMLLARQTTWGHGFLHALWHGWPVDQSKIYRIFCNVWGSHLEHLMECCSLKKPCVCKKCSVVAANTKLTSIFPGKSASCSNGDLWELSA